MIALIQRVTQASVTVNDEMVGSINQGLLAFIGVEKDDSHEEVKKMAHRLVSYRVFSDEQDKMNLSLADIHGDLLLVSQFTLAADTQKGLRPSFSSAAAPEQAKALFDELLNMMQDDARLNQVGSGKFGANMQVSLVNDGPVTFYLKA